jgi:hypothetical protein
MAKASRATAGHGGPVTVIEVSVTRSFARRARIAFYITALSGLLLGVFAALFAEPERRALDIGVGIVAGVVAGTVVAGLVSVWPVLRSLWHWSLEIAMAVGAAWSWIALADATTQLVPPLILAVLAVFCAVVGPVRRGLVAVAWCAIVRHRLRLCFTEIIRIPHRYSAPLQPLILVARPTPAGERVWVWLRPGLEVEDLEAKLGRLAVACWASEVRIERASRRFAALVRIDVTRRDPLRGVVASPLPAVVPDFPAEAPTSPGMPPLGLDLPDVPELVPDAPTPRAPRQRSAPRRPSANPDDNPFI